MTGNSRCSGLKELTVCDGEKSLLLTRQTWKKAQLAVMKAKGLFMFEITQLPQGRLFSPGCSLVRK